MSGLPYESDARRYEEECLRELLDYYKDPHIPQVRRRFLAARLEGEYPDTALACRIATKMRISIGKSVIAFGSTIG